MTDEFEGTMEPVRILFHESYYSEFYGGQIGLYRVLERLDKSRFEPLVVCPGEGIFTERVKTLGVEVEIVPLPPKLMIFGGEIKQWSLLQRLSNLPGLIPHNRQLLTLIKDQKIDLMFCTTVRSLLTSGWAAKMARIPLLWNVKAEERRGYLRLVAYILSDKVVTISESLRKYLFEDPLMRSTSKVLMVRDGIPLEEFDPEISGISVRDEFCFTEHNLVIGAVSSLVPRKGIDVFIGMAKRLERRYPQVRFLCAGDAPHPSNLPYKESLFAQAEQLVADKVFVFAGWRDDMEAVYAAMDIFVLPSRMEGLGYVVLEAMSMAKPVVRTNTSGASESVLDRVTGYIVPVDDLDVLTEAVEGLVKDGDLRLQMGAAGRERVLQKFSVGAMVRGYEEVFLESYK